jgi:hypothetical protein
MLTGPLPIGTDNRQLSVVRLRNNRLTGTVPDGLWRLPSVYMVDLQNNRQGAGRCVAMRVPGPGFDSPQWRHFVLCMAHAGSGTIVRKQQPQRAVCAGLSFQFPPLPRHLPRALSNRAPSLFITAASPG